MTILDALNHFVNISDWKTAGDDTQYHITSDESGNVIISFLGSNSKTDWLNNFRFWKKPYKNMEIKFRVHSGFLKCWKACQDEIMDQLIAFNPQSIVIIGHSYGGAMATLCMEDCWFRFIHEREINGDDAVAQTSLRGKIKCITFGAPRILGLLHYKKVKERWEGTTLVNNSSDIVPTLPPFLFLYKHVTEQTHVGKLRHFWEFFNTKYHNLQGDISYKHYLEEILNGK